MDSTSPWTAHLPPDSTFHPWTPPLPRNTPWKHPLFTEPPSPAQHLPPVQHLLPLLHSTFPQETTSPPRNSTPPPPLVLKEQVVHILLECILVTTHKQTLQRLCFYRCLSVYRGVCVARGHAWQGVFVVGGMHGGAVHIHGMGACVAGGHVW